MAGPLSTGSRPGVWASLLAVFLGQESSWGGCCFWQLAPWALSLGWGACGSHTQAWVTGQVQQPPGPSPLETPAPWQAGPAGSRDQCPSQGQARLGSAQPRAPGSARCPLESIVPEVRVVPMSPSMRLDHPPLCGPGAARPSEMPCGEIQPSGPMVWGRQRLARDPVRQGQARLSP